MKLFPRVVLCLACLSNRLFAANFAVTSPGFFYEINGSQPNPTLTLVRGQTYTFAVNTASVHPFQILAPGTLINNNISSGTITYTVPTNAPATINPGYRCSIHTSGIVGTILTVAPTPPPPPTVRILSLSVSNSLRITSTGTNGYSVFPEFSTNLTTTNWFALTVQTNLLLNGVNDTVCGRPPGSNVFIRVRSAPN